MDRIRITVETVTATFLHVEPDGEARWRAAPFRGLARWWFRALVGASLLPDEVRKREADLFGTAETPSAVAFRIFPDGVSRTQSKAQVNPGSQMSAPRNALAARSKATLEIVQADRKGSPEETVRHAYAALWVAIHFGGVGQRCRRGAGSLKMFAPTGVRLPLPEPLVTGEVRTYAELLGRGLQEARDVLGARRMRPVAPEAEYSVVHPACASAWVARLALGKGGGAGPQASEEEVRRRLMDARRGLQSHRERKPEREFGGLNPRLASPVWVRVADIREDAAVLVVTLMCHRGGTRADWENVKRFVTALDREAAPVTVGEGAA